jgi:hypothetical protein
VDAVVVIAIGAVDIEAVYAPLLVELATPAELVEVVL